MHPQRNLIEAAQQIAENEGSNIPHPSSFFLNMNFHKEHSKYYRSSPTYRRLFDDHLDETGNHNQAHFTSLATLGINSRYIRKEKMPRINKPFKFSPKVEKPKDPQGRLFSEPPPSGHPDI